MARNIRQILPCSTPRKIAVLTIKIIDNAQIRCDADILGAQIRCDADISFHHVVMCDVWSQILLFCVGVDRREGQRIFVSVFTCKCLDLPRNSIRRQTIFYVT